MLVLAAGGWQAVLLPEAGAAFASLTRDGRDVLAPIPPGGDPNSARAGAFWMIPWSNRIEDGRFRWSIGAEGEAGEREHRYPVNDLSGGNAIHGLAREHPWEMARSAPDSARLVQRFAARDQPYRYEAVLEVSLTPAGLRLALGVTNAAPTILPFGFGWHPWFVRPEGTRLGFHATHRFAKDARNLLTEALPSPGLEGGEADWLGLDGHFAGWDGVARLELGGAPLELRAEGAWAGNLQVYAPRDKAVLCVEPVSHITNVLHRRALAPWGDMAWLAPEESLSASLTLAEAP
ncbi:aldose epimerase [Roseomonas sp. OT10]|uniref:aldose epimerase family protein n=1 Tax=Roseomonas cutis TaxID=2897332 RepID=UPI001E2C8143|nr:aldose epimerase [Roseomonas sp. OT10]UFN50375.1 aldose epimerase [Roseomonas sp. OT10]